MNLRHRQHVFLLTTAALVVVAACFDHVARAQRAGRSESGSAESGSAVRPAGRDGAFSRAIRGIFAPGGIVPESGSRIRPDRPDRNDPEGGSTVRPRPQPGPQPEGGSTIRPSRQPEGGSIEKPPRAPEGGSRVAPRRNPDPPAKRTPDRRPDENEPQSPTPRTARNTPATTAAPSIGRAGVEPPVAADPTRSRLQDLQSLVALVLTFLAAAAIVICLFKLAGVKPAHHDLWSRQFDLTCEVARLSDRVLTAALSEDWNAFQEALEELNASSGMRTVLLNNTANSRVIEFTAAALNGHHHRNEGDWLPALRTAYERLVLALRDFANPEPVNMEHRAALDNVHEQITSIATARKWSHRLR